jgi:peptide/nickel transport system substrate-binding protein
MSRSRVIGRVSLALLCFVPALVECRSAGNRVKPVGTSGDLDAFLAYTPEENLQLAEAPMLAVRVARGELPPVEERLPERPLVVPVVEAPGYYGGTWRKFDLTTDFVAMKLLNSYYPLVRWTPDSSGVSPGLAESWEYTNDGREIRFHLRKGVKWSDGHPLTSADILFWWELCLDERHPMAPPEWAFSNGKRMDVRAPDPHTLVFSFDSPFYFVPLLVATGFWWPETMLLPRHYLEAFHPDLNAAHDDFVELDRKMNTAVNPLRPTLGPWRLVSYSATGDRCVFERNPFCISVDAQGRQLPYIDRIEAIRVQSAEAGVLYTISGAVDAQFRQIAFEDYALLKRFADKGEYRIETWEEGTAAWHAIFLNWSPVDLKTHEPDADRRQLFRDPQFRRGLAVAVNRERINQVVWNGISRPQAAAIADESWHFNSNRGRRVRQEWITRWSQYAPDEANAFLDRAGLRGRDREGFRLQRGRRFELVLDFVDMPYAPDEAALIREDWQAVGIRTLLRPSMGTDLWTRVQQGRYDMYLQHNSELDLFTFPGYVFPVTASTWHPRVGRWYATGGEEGEPPEGFMKELLELYEACKREPDLERRHERVLDAIEIQLEHGPFMIGTTGRQKSLVVVKRDMRNIPRTAILGPWAQCQPGASFPEQIFFDPARLYGKGGRQ